MPSGCRGDTGPESRSEKINKKPLPDKLLKKRRRTV